MNIIQSFQGSNFVQFSILKFVTDVNSNTPEAILSVNFRLFGKNFVTSFIFLGIKQQAIEEVYGVGLKNLFVLKNVSRREMSLVISRCRKTLVISTSNQTILCYYFEHLLAYLYDLDIFIYVPGIWMNTSLRL